VVVRVPGKLNLCLQVGPRLSDGFHELATLFHAVSLYDTLRASPAEGISVAVSGDGAAEVSAGGDNLAVRAARALALRAGVRDGVHLEIDKAIPVAGGMAGGSADAAAALVACDALWGTGCDRTDLTEIAAELGSDVPFALHGGTALGTGRGQRLTEVMARGQYHWVLALADGGLSTPRVYATHDQLAQPPGPSPDGVIAALRSGDPHQLGATLSNDLQPAALRLRPALRRVLSAGRELGAVGGVVSGSGPTVALLAVDADRATALAASLAAEGVCRAVRCVHGPVGGARLLDQPA
jgi:4-diphosphocytidyl-2-C-methyl-D-erythritol kinase